MTTPVTRVLVTHEGGQFVTRAPMDVADVLFPRDRGYELRVVRGFDGPYGFVFEGRLAR